MAGRDWIAGESQTPGWNWEQQESIMLGLDGPATEKEQSMEEQGTWMKISLCHDKRIKESNLCDALLPQEALKIWLPTLKGITGFHESKMCALQVALT